jgi:hypothetical protein
VQKELRFVESNHGRGVDLKKKSKKERKFLAELRFDRRSINC